MAIETFKYIFIYNLIWNFDCKAKLVNNIDFKFGNYFILIYEKKIVFAKISKIL